MINLIPMAGNGARFQKEGYIIPKPLINISGNPMIIQAARALPKADKWVFVCRREHIDQYHIDIVLKKHLSNVHIISIDYLTEGQACTCMLAENELEDSQSLVIGACDNTMVWDKARFKQEAEEADGLIWTFRNNVTVKYNPQMYGWVRVDEDAMALEVSCKVPISKNPIRDHAVIGTFYFKQAAYFKQAVKNMIKKNIRINNEFYIDVAMNEMIQDGLKVKVFEVDQYICWGTPNDLKTYQYWESYFQKSRHELK